MASKTYLVEDDGKAPSGLSVGDTVVTGGGTWRIDGVDPETGEYTETQNISAVTPAEFTGNYANGGSYINGVLYQPEEGIRAINYTGSNTNTGYGSNVYSALDDIQNATNNWDYDVYSDPEYDDLTNSLHMGADDTAGQIAARTGGLASSYAATAAQQQYNSGLNEGIAALKADAQSQRQTDLSNKYSLLNTLMGLQDSEYGRGRDTVSDNQWSTNRQDQIIQSLLDRKDSLTAQERSYAYDNAMDMINKGIVPSTELLTAAGIDVANAQSLAEYNKSQQ